MVVYCVLILCTMAGINGQFDGDAKGNFPTAVRTRLFANASAIPYVICPTSGGYTDLLERSETVIDKSLFIKALLSDKSKTSLILYPKSWGKTTIAYMLKTFFECRSNGEGVLTPREKTREYRYFYKGNLSTGAKKIAYSFAPLIAKNPPILDAYLRRYPVIMLDFRRVYSANDSESLYECFKNTIAQAFRQHGYLARVLKRRSTELKYDSRYRQNADHQRKFFEEIVESRQSLSEDDLKSCVLFLSELLYTFYSRDVIIIVNEYDKLIMNMYFDMHIPSEECEKFEKFFGGFLETTLVQNTHLYRGMIFGEMKLDCAKKFNIFAHKFPFFGFARSEVEKLFYHRLSVDLRASAHQWYGGYRYGFEYDPLFTCGSIGYLLNEQQISNYWEKTHNTTFLEGMMKSRDIRDLFEHLLFSYTQRLEMCSYIFTSERLSRLKELVDGKLTEKLSMIEFEMVLFFLKARGYLTSKFSNLNLKRGSILLLVIPNREVEYTIIDKLICYYFKTIDNAIIDHALEVSKVLLTSMTEDRTGSSIGNLEEKFSALFRYLCNEKNNGTALINDDPFLNDVIFLTVMYTKLNYYLTFSRQGPARRRKHVNYNHGMSMYFTDWQNEVVTELKFNFNSTNSSNVSILTPSNVSVGFKIKHVKFIGVHVNECGDVKIQHSFVKIEHEIFTRSDAGNVTSIPGENYTESITNGSCEVGYSTLSNLDDKNPVTLSSPNAENSVNTSSTVDEDHVSTSSLDGENSVTLTSTNTENPVTLSSPDAEHTVTLISTNAEDHVTLSSPNAENSVNTSSTVDKDHVSTSGRDGKTQVSTLSSPDTKHPVNTSSTVDIDHVSTSSPYGENPVTLSTPNSKIPVSTSSTFNKGHVISTSSRDGKAQVSTLSSPDAKNSVNTSSTVDEDCVSTSSRDGKIQVSTLSSPDSKHPVTLSSPDAKNPVNTSSTVDKDHVSTSSPDGENLATLSSPNSKIPVNTSSTFNKGHVSTSSRDGKAQVSTLSSPDAKNSVNTSSTVDEDCVSTSSRDGKTQVSTLSSPDSKHPVTLSSPDAKNPVNTSSTVDKDHVSTSSPDGENLATLSSPNSKIPVNTSSTFNKGHVSTSSQDAQTQVSTLSDSDVKNSVTLASTNAKHPVTLSSSNSKIPVNTSSTLHKGHVSRRSRGKKTKATTLCSPDGENLLNATSSNPEKNFATEKTT